MGAFKVEFFDDQGQHQYCLDGQEVPSVTTVLSAEALSDYSYCTERDRLRGSAVHAIALLLTKRPWKGSTPQEIVANSLWDPSTTAPALVPYGMACASFLCETGFRPALVETPVGSKRLMICGTLDAYGEMPTSTSMLLRTLIDYKSGRPLPGADVQTALYEMCLKETLDLTTDQRIVVWLKSNGEYQVFPPRPSGGPDLAIGIAATSLYHWRRRNKLI
jgi:hypothetical protein